MINKFMRIIIFIIFCAAIISCKKEDNNLNPSVRFSEPQDNSSILEDSTLRISLIPMDDDGNISKVDLLLDNSLLSTLTVSPYQFYWNPTKEDIGLHKFKAIAYDDNNSLGESEIQITILDYRDSITGDYTGIRVDTHWGGDAFILDTSLVDISVLLSELDSIVDIDFTPDYYYESISFKYENNNLTSLEWYHSPYMKIQNDSLYYEHQAGLGPNYTEFFAQRVY
ncbi:MAG: Ig-like domain-containing protein [Cryomorphaceae bacterium]